MLTLIIVTVIYGHLGCGAIGGALFSPILRRRIRHLNERYFATRVDVMVALVCGFYTLVQVTRIIINTEREISRRRRDQTQAESPPTNERVRS
jgi:hypothetical protein